MESLNLIAIAVIIGVVNGFALTGAPQLTPFVKFLLALALGLAFGIIGLFGLNIQTGLISALASSGLYTVAKRIGGQ